MTGQHGLRRVLIVDDEPLITTTYGRALTAAGYTVTTTHDAATAREALHHVSYDAALIDLRLRFESGFDVLEQAVGLEVPPAILMMSGSADLTSAVLAMRRGSDDFLEKPLSSSELVARVECAIESRRLKAHELHSHELLSVVASHAIGGAMRDALLLADRVAATPCSSALLVGESGVGKEIVAARIHKASGRRDGPFVCVNLAALPESVLEAELFGSVKGAYTDAKSNRAGYLASADGGTLLLDEIGEFRTENQPKLLRVLEERRFFPVGSDRERAVDVRVLAATNRDPAWMLETGLLREDLFYRLGTVIRIPPLRERKEEIVQLARHFLGLFCAEFGRPECYLSHATEARLEDYSWPGNIRQLRNAVERALMVSDGDEILPQGFDLPPQGLPPRASEPPAFVPESGLQSTGLPGFHDERRRAVETVERDQIERALDAAHGSRSRAAVMLGFARSTLYDRMKRYSIK